MEMFMNFNKPIISKNVMEFLEANLKHEDDKTSFTRLLKGNKLLYKEANSFIETLLRSITIADGTENVAFVPVNKIPEDHLTDEPFNQATPGSSGTQKTLTRTQKEVVLVPGQNLNFIFAMHLCIVHFSFIKVYPCLREINFIHTYIHSRQPATAVPPVSLPCSG